MNCLNCGRELKEGAKFCPGCGTKVETEAPKMKNIFCSYCGTKLEADALFCSKCGKPTNSAEPEIAMPESGGRLLTVQKLISMYMGEPTVGLAKASGTLSVYDDRIEFEKQMGNALGGAFGLAGLLVARNAAKKEPVVVYSLSDVAEVRVGKYMGVYNTFVVALKNGNIITFCPAIPGSPVPQSIVDVLRPYLQ